MPSYSGGGRRRTPAATCGHTPFKWSATVRTVPYLISPASLGSVRLISGMQMISSNPVKSASMYGT